MGHVPSKEETSKALEDPVNFKFVAAGTILEKVPNYVPLQLQTRAHFDMELAVESFLFFAVSAMDIVFSEVNKKMSLNIPDTYVTGTRLVRELKKKKPPKSEIIISELEKHCQPPKHMISPTTQESAHEYSEKHLNGSLGLDFWSIFENRMGSWFKHEWDRSSSSLWEIRQLRNQITHGTLLKQSGERGTVKPRDAITVHLVKNATKAHEMHFIYDPKTYFSKAFSDSMELANGIRRNL